MAALKHGRGTSLLLALGLIVGTACAPAAPAPTSAPKPTEAAKPAAPAPAPAASPAAAPAAPAAAASPAAAPAAKPAASPAAESKPAAAAPAAKPAGPPVKITMGVAGEVLAYSPTNIAVAAKLFEEQGLEVERVVLQGDAAVNTALTSGDIQVGAMTTTSMLNAANRGAPRIAVYGLMNKMSLDLVINNAYLDSKGVTPSDPYDKRLKAVPGGRYATISLGGGSDRITRYLVKLAGADPQNDLQMVQLGGVPQMVGGLKQNVIDGYMLSAPTGFQAESEGYAKILIKGSEVPELQGYHFTAIIVTPDYLRQNPDVVKRMNAALTKASDLIAKEPERATDLLQPFFQAVQKDVLRKSVDSLRDGVDRGGRFSQDAWQRVVAVEQTFDPEMKLNAQSGQGTWWTNEHLPQ